MTVSNNTNAVDRLREIEPNFSFKSSDGVGFLTLPGTGVVSVKNNTILKSGDQAKIMEFVAQKFLNVLDVHKSDEGGLYRLAGIKADIKKYGKIVYFAKTNGDLTKVLTSKDELIEHVHYADKKEFSMEYKYKVDSGIIKDLISCDSIVNEQRTPLDFEVIKTNKKGLLKRAQEKYKTLLLSSKISKKVLAPSKKTAPEKEETGNDTTKVLEAFSYIVKNYKEDFEAFRKKITGAIDISLNVLIPRLGIEVDRPLQALLDKIGNFAMNANINVERTD